MTNTAAVPRIVVTGLGTINAHGVGVDKLWSGVLSGKSGIRKIESFDASELASKVGAEVHDFEVSDFMDVKEARRNDRFTHFAVASSRLAIADAGIQVEALEAERFGVFVGSGIGGLQTIHDQTARLIERGPRKVSPFMIPSLIGNIASGVVAIELGAKGPNFGIVSACSSATHSIGEAFNTLRNGHADVMIAGGSEAAVCQLGYAGFCSMKAMSTNFNDCPEEASRPFEKSRDGFVMGEGAGVLILETLEHAQARGAKIYCELAAFDSSCDAYHITSPDPEGRALSKSFKSVVSEAGLAFEDVNYINAHGTSTPYNDKFETKAIKEAFGDHAHNLLISSTKSMTGHLLGAAGGIESAICAKVIKEGKVPPTINHFESDPECDLNYVPNESIASDVKVAICNNSGFGGHNAVLLFRSFAD
jgi:3-oxoacyl-[acyl-carrier-protein] synthase II